MCEGFLYRPSFIKPLIDSVAVYTKCLGPLSYTHGFPVMRDKPIQRIISILFASCGPSTIRWGVAFRVFNPFDCVFWCRFLTHVSQKVFKTIHPARTYFNVLICLVRFIWPCASRFHRHPTPVLRGKRHPVSLLKFTSDFIFLHRGNLQKINDKYNGLKDRAEHWYRCQKALGIQQINFIQV